MNTIPSVRWRRILPPTILVYLFSFMDRTNIGFAMAGGMNEALGITAATSGLAAGIFFVGYMLLQIPGGHIAEHGSAKRFIAATIFAWGGLSILCGLVENATQLILVRFLIGVAEGGVWPAMLVLLSHWFPNQERGRANAWFFMNIAIASILTGPLSGWILAHFGWRWVFLLEGLLSILLIFVWWPLISDRPEEAKWISPEEKNYLSVTLRAEQEAFFRDNAGDLNWTSVFFNRNMAKLILIYFFYQIGIYGFTLWLPTLIRELTQTGMVQVGFLSTLPYFAMMAGLLFFARLSDRSGNRRLHTALPILGFALCFLFSTLTKNRIGISFAFLVACGFFLQSASGIFWTIPPLLFPAKFAGSARGLINALGNLGGFLGPFAFGWFRTVFPATEAGVYFLVITLLSGFLFTLSLPVEIAGRRHMAESP